MKIEHPVYNDLVMALNLVAENQSDADKGLYRLAMRYLSPEKSTNKQGQIVDTTNVMGGETDWFILPHTFGCAIGKVLIEQKVSGYEGFNEEGFKRMVDWLIDMEELQDCMCY